MRQNGAFKGLLMNHTNGLRHGTFRANRHGDYRGDFYKSEMTVEYRTILNYAQQLGYAVPSIVQQIKQNNLIIELKAYGIWRTMDVVYVPCNNAGLNFSKINWRSPGLFTLTPLGASPVTHTSNQGFIGTATGYMNTGWSPGTNGVNYKTNNASVLCWSFDDSAITNNVLYGATNASSSGRVILDPENADGTVTWQINRTGAKAASGSAGNSSGLWHSEKWGAGEMELYKAGVLFDSESAITDSITTQSMYLMAFNNNGTAASFGSTRKMAFFSAGSSIRRSSLLVNQIVSKYISNP